MCGEMIVSETIRAGKAHRCEACCVPIPKGATHVRTVEASDGRVFSTRWHRECREAFDAMLNEYYEDCGFPDQTWERGMPPEIETQYVYGPPRAALWQPEEARA